MARYRKLDQRTWNDQKFRELTPLPPSGQSLWLYLILGPFTTNIPGLFEASEVAMADRLGWSLEDFRQAFHEVSSKGMAKADWKARLVWLPNAPEYNKPESPNVVKSWGATFDELPECALKWEAYQALKAFMKGMKKGFQDAFDHGFPKPSVKGMPNQEQEQEQEQEDTPPTPQGGRRFAKEFHEQVIAAYHELLPELPAVRDWPERRRRKLDARIAERLKAGKPADQVSYWRAFFSQVHASDFLCGRKGDWRCPGLEWLLEPKNFTKVIEGAYQNHDGMNGAMHAR